jgi:hypothetical protein
MVGEITLYFYVPMFRWKDFFDGTDRENAKTQGGKGQMKKILKKNKKERTEERKRRDFLTYVKVPILLCSPLVGNGLGLPLLCDPPLGEPHSYGNLPYNKTRQHSKRFIVSCLTSSQIGHIL